MSSINGTLGVSVYCLKNTLLKDVEDAGLDATATVYEIEDLREKEKFGVIRRKGASVFCPRDKKIGAAYVDCLKGIDNVGPANRMLSYVWGYTVGSIVDSLETYCHQTRLDTKRTYIWICCLCNNQHRFKDEVPFNTLYNNFKDKVVGVGHILAMMAPWNKPKYLERVWCIFEMHTAHTADDVKVEIIMPPKEEGEMFLGLYDYNNFIKALVGARIENAEAFNESDKVNIMKLVNNTTGGAAALNNNVNKLLRRCYQTMMLAAVETLGSLNDIDTFTDLKYAHVCNLVGRVMKEINNYEKAVELLEKCLAVYENVHGKEHKETALLYNNIGVVMKDKGDFDGAFKMYNKCLAVREKVYGEEHTSTAVCYNNIASVMAQKGDLDGALEMFHKSLVVLEKVYGKDHTTTAESYNNIAEVMRLKGDLDGALKMHYKALAVREKVYGKEHTITASSYNNIAAVMTRKGDLDGALEKFHKSLAVWEKVHGEEHMNTAVSYVNIGMVMKQKGDIDGALEMFYKSLAVREKILGKGHISTGNLYWNIGCVMEDKDDIDAALEFFHKALAIDEKVYGEDHKQTLMKKQVIARLQK